MLTTVGTDPTTRPSMVVRNTGPIVLLNVKPEKPALKEIVPQKGIFRLLVLKMLTADQLVNQDAAILLNTTNTVLATLGSSILKLTGATEPSNVGGTAILAQIPFLVRIRGIPASVMRMLWEKMQPVFIAGLDKQLNIVLLINVISNVWARLFWYLPAQIWDMIDIVTIPACVLHVK